jgi:hypothetical protein
VIGAWAPDNNLFNLCLPPLPLLAAAERLHRDFFGVAVERLTPAALKATLA